MTPKRFKAVRKSDGLEAFSNFDLMEAIKESNHCAGSIDVDGFFSFDLNSTPDLDDVEICQSTGLTDAMGQEVYDGDVLFMIVDDDLMLFCVERSSSNTCIELYPMDGDYRFIEPIDNYVEDNRIDHIVIGNKWQPAAELQARAEAVSDRY